MSALDAGQNDSATRIEMPWGDYAVINRGDGSYWVGSYKDYEHSRVVGMSSDLGFRVSSVKESGATETFAQADSLHATFRNGAIDGVTPAVDFRSDSGIPKSKWLDITWTQSVESPVSCTLLDPRSHRLAKIQQRDDDQLPFHTDSIIVDNKWLVMPVDVICVTFKSPPTIMPVNSIVRLDYTLTTKSMGGLPLDARQKNHVAALRKLDPTLDDRTH